MKKLLGIGFCLFCLPAYAVTNFDTLPDTDVAKFLGWTKSTEKDNLCGGYYHEPGLIFNYPTPPDAKKAPTTITTDKKVTYKTKGDTILTGNVVISQTGRRIKADKIVIHQDPETGKHSSADLYGHVQLREYGKLIVGKHGFINFKTNVMTIDHGIYHLASADQSVPGSTLDLWGKMRYAIRDESKMLTLHNASFSTCQPVNSAWHFKSSQVKIDKKAGSGTAKNTVFYIKNIPVAYSPYLWFPTDNRRKTGFLFPTLGYSSDSGAELFLPFYLNLAPNYDATITPKIYTKRGVLAEGIFRYLTEKSQGQLQLDYIYDDRAFAKFKKDAPSEYADQPEELSRLEKKDNNRGSFSFQNQTKFNDHWSNEIDLNYVSDDYYMSDFGTLPADVNDNQLPNRFDLNFDSEYWRFLGRVQAFQTLHQFDDSAEDQYSRLPQLDLIGNYPNQKYGLNYQLNSEFIYFDNKKFMFDSDIKNPIGSRINIQPAISLPLNWGAAYIDPKIQAQGTFYSLYNREPGDSNSITRILPIFNIDSGLLFERNMHFLGNNYTQTLEPRLYYLYVPYTGQNDIPMFDTNLSTFNFDNLFRTNRFSSIDRMGDANQFTLALTSRFLDGNTGEEKLRASVGEILAIQKHKVCDMDDNNNPDCSADPLTKENISPAYGELQYYLNPNWNVTGDIAWDFKEQELNSSSVTFQYKPDPDRIINLSYNYQIDGDSFDNKTVDLNRISISATWPLMHRWHVLGDWDYNFSYHNAQTYFYGLEYDSCCWALRFVGARIYKTGNKFDNQFYIQVLLKGLGSLGFNNPGGLLTSNISGYKDRFAGSIL
jgi:LPS-assembly protein